MVLQPDDLNVASGTKGAEPKRIYPAPHGGCQSRKFAAVASALTLPVGTPVAYNADLDAFQAWDPNTGLAADTAEVQKLIVAASVTGGTFKFVFKGVASGTVAYNASAATMQTALQAMSTVGSGNALVTGTGPFTITFAGTLGHGPQPLIVPDNTLLVATADSTSGVTITESTVGVAAGSTNEVVTISQLAGTSTAGTFTITYDGQTTTPIAYNASAATVLAAVIALSNVPAGGFTASGGALPTAVVLTAAGALVGADLPQMFIDSSGMTGGTYAAVSSPQGDSADGAPAPAGTIIGFVYPFDIVLDTAGEVFGRIMGKGEIHRDDVVLPTVGAPTDAQLDAALRDGPWARGLLVQHLSNVH